MVGDDVVERMAQSILAKVPLGYGMTKAEAAEYARAALSALEPEWCVVPRDPTHDMRLAGARSIGATMGMDNHMARAESAYDAMLNVVVLTASQETSSNG